MTSDYAVLVDVSPYTFSELLVVHISLLNANNEFVEKCIRMTQEELVYDAVSKIILRHTKSKKIVQSDSVDVVSLSGDFDVEQLKKSNLLRGNRIFNMTANERGISSSMQDEVKKELDNRLLTMANSFTLGPQGPSLWIGLALEKSDVLSEALNKRIRFMVNAGYGIRFFIFELENGRITSVGERVALSVIEKTLRRIKNHETKPIWEWAGDKSTADEIASHYGICLPEGTEIISSVWTGPVPPGHKEWDDNKWADVVFTGETRKSCDAQHVESRTMVNQILRGSSVILDRMEVRTGASKFKDIVEKYGPSDDTCLDRVVHTKAHLDINVSFKEHVTVFFSAEKRISDKSINRLALLRSAGIDLVFVFFEVVGEKICSPGNPNEYIIRKISDGIGQGIVDVTPYGGQKLKKGSLGDDGELGTHVLVGHHDEAKRVSHLVDNVLCHSSDVNHLLQHESIIRLILKKGHPGMAYWKSLMYGILKGDADTHVKARTCSVAFVMVDAFDEEMEHFYQHLKAQFIKWRKNNALLGLIFTTIDDDGKVVPICDVKKSYLFWKAVKCSDENSDIENIPMVDVTPYSIGEAVPEGATWLNDVVAVSIAGSESPVPVNRYFMSERHLDAFHPVDVACLKNRGGGIECIRKFDSQRLFKNIRYQYPQLRILPEGESVFVVADAGLHVETRTFACAAVIEHYSQGYLVERHVVTTAGFCMDHIFIAEGLAVSMGVKEAKSWMREKGFPPESYNIHSFTDSSALLKRIKSQLEFRELGGRYYEQVELNVRMSLINSGASFSKVKSHVPNKRARHIEKLHNEADALAKALLYKVRDSVLSPRVDDSVAGVWVPLYLKSREIEGLIDSVIKSLPSSIKRLRLIFSENRKLLVFNPQSDKVRDVVERFMSAGFDVIDGSLPHSMIYAEQDGAGRRYANAWLRENDTYDDAVKMEIVARFEAMARLGFGVVEPPNLENPLLNVASYYKSQCVVVPEFNKRYASHEPHEDLMSILKEIDGGERIICVKC